MEIFNDSSWYICGKEKGMAIRGNSTREDHSTYSPNHIKAILKGIGLDINGETGNDFLCLCPFHSNRHTPSFSVSKESGKFICFNPACGEAGTVNDLVKRVLHKNDFEAIRFIANKETESLNNFDEVLEDILSEKPQFEEFSQETLDKLYNELGNSNAARDYLKSRGINEESMQHFKLGYSSNMNMVITPVHSPDGMPIGLVGRSIEGKSFKNSTNLPNVVATLGGFLSPEQHYLLNRYFNRIIIMTDADKAGRELGYSIASKLRNKDILWASHEYGKIYPHEAKDAGDMTTEEIVSCIKNAVSDIEYRSWTL